MKKHSIIICLIIVILAVCTSASTPTSSNYLFKTIHPNTSLYFDASLLSEVLIDIPQNAEVTVVGEPFYQGEILWQKVEYAPFSGYVLYNSIYKSIENEPYNVRIVKAVSKSMGQKISLYVAHDASSEKIEVNDGTKLNLIITEVNYGDFQKVEYQSNTYYVLKDNITTGLSYNQLIAVILASALVVLLIATSLIIIMIRKRKLSIKK
ncbi:hypothetical protein EOM82_05230 [bacterium]|nr:hypothetical protein [bacterium]